MLDLAVHDDCTRLEADTVKKPEGKYKSKGKSCKSRYTLCLVFYWSSITEVSERLRESARHKSVNNLPHTLLTQFLIFRQLLAKVIVAEGRELDLEVGDEVLAMQRMPSPCLVVENVIRLVRTSNCDIVYNTRMKDIRPMIEA